MLNLFFENDLRLIGRKKKLLRFAYAAAAIIGR